MSSFETSEAPPGHIPRFLRLLQPPRSKLRHRHSSNSMTTTQPPDNKSPTNMVIGSTESLPMPNEFVDSGGFVSKSTVQFITTNTAGPGVKSETPVAKVTDRSNSPYFDAPPAYSPPSVSERQPDRFEERHNTKQRYEQAVKKLEESLNAPRAHWKPITIPKFNDILQNDPLPQLREELTNSLRGQKRDKNRGWVERGFTAISPFAKNFLRIAKEGQSVQNLVIRRSVDHLVAGFESLWFALWRAFAFDNGIYRSDTYFYFVDCGYRICSRKGNRKETGVYL